ncbi:MAG: protein kinase [Pseudomonadota bacterium]|nr:protein kinase [Pseudomonadota bacterium]
MQEETDNQNYPDIPGYKILSELGRGGIATVYLAVQESLDRQVALKVMSPLLAMEPDYAERFIREGRTVAQLSHSNIITVYDIGLQKHQLFIAMEYIAGGNMRTLMPDHVNDPEWALSIAGQIALALGYAHTVGIVHRDVKPENILFRENGSAILTDFGIAKTITSNTNLTRAGTIIGTPKYMSPEQTDGLGNDPRTDVYSLGIILFEMLTGNVPYDSENSMAVLYAHVHAPIPDLPDELSDLQPLINNLLAKKAEDRTEDCDELAEIIRITRRERHYALKDPARMLEANLTQELKIPSRGKNKKLQKKRDSEKGPLAWKKKLSEFTASLKGPDKKRLLIAAALIGSIALISIILMWKDDSSGPASIAESNNLAENVEAPIEQTPAVQVEPSETLASPDTAASITPPTADNKINAEISALTKPASSTSGREPEINDAAPQTDINPEEGNQTALLISRFLADESNDELVKQQQAAAPDSEEEKNPPVLSSKQKKINNLLTDARAAVKDGQIISPKNTNAVTYYKQVLELSPRNKRALRGLTVSGDLIVENARGNYKAGKPDIALRQIDTALQEIPDHENLLKLKQTIEASFNPNSSYAKAEKLHRGVDSPRNRTRAAFYYKKAAELGHIQAMNDIGVAYADGDGIRRNDKKAMEWLEKSADLGNSEAMYNLALGYHFSALKNPSKAMPWVTQAAEKEYRPAYMLIGWMTTTGAGTQASRISAIRWDLKGMVNPISSELHSQYRIPRKWQDKFMIQYKKATNTGP